MPDGDEEKFQKINKAFQNLFFQLILIIIDFVLTKEEFENQ